jgi:hypothetical protein
MKTSELTGAALDWAVAKCEEVEYMAEAYEQEIPFFYREEATRYSTNWSQGGPIIEREGITAIHFGDDWQDDWQARRGDGHWQGELVGGPTPLIAAMRCYVASKLGDEVEIPKEITA